MKPTEDLHELIRSLSKAEKRYFRLFASRYESNGKNNYDKLFDAIEKQEEYNESALKKQFSKETFVKHLPSEKNYLYNLILDSLHMYYCGQGEEARQRKRLHQAKLLLSRGLALQSAKMLKRIKKAAAEHELYDLLLECIQLEKQLLARRSYSDIEEDKLETLYREEKECISLIEEANEYWLLFSRFYRLYYQSGSTRSAADQEKIREIMQNPLLEDIDRARIFRTKLDFLHINALYNFISGQHREAAVYNRQYLELLESRPDQLKLHNKRYMATLNNYLMDSMGMKQYAEVEKGIEKMRSLPEQYPFYRNVSTANDIFRLTVILELNLYIKTGKFQEGLRRAPGIANELKEREEQIAQHNKLTIYYLLAYLYFGAGQYSETVRWLNRIINETDESVMQDIHAFARIFSLITHYELNNIDILDYLYTSTYRYLVRKKKTYPAETLLLKYLKKFGSIAGRRELKEAFAKLKDELLETQKDPAGKKAFEYFDLIAWLDSKINNTSFAAEVARHAA